MYREHATVIRSNENGKMLWHVNRRHSPRSLGDKTCTATCARKHASVVLSRLLQRATSMLASMDEHYVMLKLTRQSFTLRHLDITLDTKPRKPLIALRYKRLGFASKVDNTFVITVVILHCNLGFTRSNKLSSTITLGLRVKQRYLAEARTLDHGSKRNDPTTLYVDCRKVLSHIAQGGESRDKQRYLAADRTLDPGSKSNDPTTLYVDCRKVLSHIAQGGESRDKQRYLAADRTLDPGSKSNDPTTLYVDCRKVLSHIAQGGESRDKQRYLAADRTLDPGSKRNDPTTLYIDCRKSCLISLFQTYAHSAKGKIGEPTRKQLAQYVEVISYFCSYCIDHIPKGSELFQRQ
ncbi:hypothetical protein J6590_067302 [Homalodisca vitripennis]|nr:hypothetical protein J6590_067302 [Homalodisca vitripennis]